MDAKERLRRYLEQRRELGESELVLDSLGVDEVLRIVGAGGAERAATGAGSAERAATGAGGAGRAGPGSSAAPGAPATRGEATDAKATDAKATDAKAMDAAPADHPALRGEAVDAPSAESQLGTGAGASYEPEHRERGGLAADVPDAGSGDWRAMLRAAGGAPDQRGRLNPPPPVEDQDMARKRAAGARGTARGEKPADEGMAPSSAPGAAAVPDAAGGRRAEGVPAPAKMFPGVDVPAGLVVGDDLRVLSGGPFDHLDSLDAVARSVHQCTRCPLYKTATHGVPGEGNPDADFVVVGEAPGAEEDATGRPFVGASGQLLTKILGAINLAREDVFICNVVKHRPPGNRNPTPDEVEACSPYLVRQLELLRPKVILTVGNFAAQTLLGTKLGISKLRGQVHLYHGIPLVATFHPAALLRNPNWKRPTWEDVQLARRLLDRATSG